MQDSVRNFLAVCGVAAGVAFGPASSVAQQNIPSTVPGSPNGFNYPMSLEAVHASPKNHHILYEDTHVRLLEVTLWPGDKEGMHGHAYPSIFAFDAIQPKMDNEHYEKTDTGPPFGPHVEPAGAPEFPRCIAMAPQSPHAATILDPYPQHFYRMEFKRVDGSNGFAQKWRAWYPQATTGRILRFHNDHVRLVEVTIRPGETTPAVASPYWSVLAYDTPAPGAPGGPIVRVDGKDTDPSANQHGEHPPGWEFPTCEAVGPAPPERITNTSDVLVHYYRVEFARVDGRDFAKNWKTWYPRMAKGPPAAGGSH